MEINIIKDEKQQIEVELVGETHTLVNAVTDECYNDSKVTSATYIIDHPLKSNPKLIIKTKGESAKKALKDAITRLGKTAAELEDKAKKSL